MAVTYIIDTSTPNGSTGQYKTTFTTDEILAQLPIDPNTHAILDGYSVDFYLEGCTPIPLTNVTQGWITLMFETETLAFQMNQQYVTTLPMTFSWDDIHAIAPDDYPSSDGEDHTYGFRITSPDPVDDDYHLNLRGLTYYTTKLKAWVQDYIASLDGDSTQY